VTYTYGGTQLFNWTSERVERARKLWNEGIVAHEIADALGAPGGGPSVRVMAKRHGFVPRTSGPGHYATRKRYRDLGVRAPESKPPKNPPRAAITSPIKAAIAPILPPRPDKGPLTLLQLGYGDCKWPINNGEPEYLFCGAQTEGTYCKSHKKRAHA
jgi:GcrA cell cycle regulator